MKLKRLIIWLVGGLIVFIYLNNSTLFQKPPAGKPWLLAHRGLGQTFSMKGITNETCTAQRIYRPEHPYLENTIPSMTAAFAAGTDTVELDIHPTKDGQIAVFHDWKLDCRTNGSGVTRDYTMAELKILDVGYGYTYDNGKTYPFRGQGVGMMPSLPEVLTRFPEQKLLINIKSNDPQEGELLAQYLSRLSAERLTQLAVYGGDEPIAVLQKKIPRLRVMSKRTLMRSLLTYMAIGWTGYVPAVCRNTQLHLPEKFAPWLWGWPHLFLKRMARANTRVILVAGNGKFSEGFDTAQDLKRLPPNYTGGVWTNRVDRIGRILYRNGR
ncbi:MAG TPA: glycerophosphodiester phosphodiesterase family protein [Bacillota bacterium]|nr:glycerophosphodiester phosphodiesterase family protein [Bacillota bacterium]